MSSNAPDVRVRLSPEGVKEVIDALRKLRTEGKAAEADAAGSTKLLTAAVRELKSVLPTIGLAAVVGGLIALVKGAIDGAEAVGHLQQKVGGAVEDLSGLQLAFRTNSSDAETMEKAMLRTADVIDAVRGGSKQTADALGRLGLNAKDFAGLDTPRAFERLAQQVANVPPGVERAAVASALFGEKLAQQLLPVLDAVGTKGIQPFIDRARELGVLIDSDLVEAASAANDALGEVKLQAEGLATQFAAGLAPQVASAMEEFSAAVQGDGFNAIRAFGEFVGFVVRNVVQAFTALGRSIGAIFASLAAISSGQIDVLKAIVTGKLRDVPAIVRRTLQQVRDISNAADEDLQASRDRLTTPRESKSAGKPAQRGTILRTITADDRQLGQARLAFLKQQIEAESKLQQQALTLRTQQDQAALDQGLISLQEYFRRRRQIVQEQAQIDIDALRRTRAAEVAQGQKDLAALEAQRARTGGDVLQQGGQSLDQSIDERKLKLKQQLASIDVDIQARELKQSQDLSSLTAEQIQAQRQLDQERHQTQNTIDELEGNRHAVFQRNLEDEITKLRELAVRAGQSAGEIESDAQRLIAARTAQFNFDELSRRASQALASYNRDADEIRRNQEAGVVSQFTGEQQLIALERDRLPILRQIAEQQLAAAQATGNPQVIEQARQLLDNVKQIQATYDGATNAGAKFMNGLDEGVDQGIRALVNQRDQIHSLGDAWRVFGDTVNKVLSDIAAELLSQQIRKGLANLAASFGSGGGGGSSLAAFFGSVGTAATGGLIVGPGTPTSDSVPILASRGEFMVKASKVAEPGALRGLMDWNFGRSANPFRRARGFAQGGPIGITSALGVHRADAPLIGAIAFNVGSAPGGNLTRATQLQTARLLAATIDEARRRNG